MPHLSRKEFLQSSAVLLASLVAGNAFASGRKLPLLAFSTLGCPDWTFDQITSFAAQHGYKGIEVRGLQRQMDLTQCPEFATAEARKQAMALMKQRGLSFVGLGSSANLHLPEGAEREKNLTEARRFIDLAAQINCPYVRVFPNNFPKEQEKRTTMDLIVKGLKELGDYARGKKVTVLMETHGEVVKIADLAEIMQSTAHPQVALVWDVANMWTVTKEPPAEAYRKLKNYIRHIHIKDAKLVDGKPKYTFLGEGEVPIFEAIDALHRGGYKGYYSFEWEKMWHPALPEPEIAFAHYPKAMKKHFASL
ncbi:MAG TPA: sugar phosphate isomerase/epimerase family protein [Chitinophagaceae bacterium]